MVARGPRGCGAGRVLLHLRSLLVCRAPARVPVHSRRTSGSPEAVGLDGFAEVSVATEDGEHIIAWWAPPPAGAGVVLYLHGTPSTLPDTVWRLPDLRESGLGVMAIDYRGYGDSTGSPSELGFRADARAAFDFIRAMAPASKVAVFGESLGTGIAVALARERPVAGVLLNAPYASVLRLFELRRQMRLRRRGTDGLSTHRWSERDSNPRSSWGCNHRGSSPVVDSRLPLTGETLLPRPREELKIVSWLKKTSSVFG